MDRAEALRSIRYDLLEYIQKQVKVDFDNVKQMPVSFIFNGKTHRVGEILGRFRTRETHPVNAFLVCSDVDEVYFLYFQWCDMNPYRPIHSGFWILSFRVLSDWEMMAFYREDRKMLIDVTFKRVVDFHGHLCPDLVLGGKFCEYVQKLLSLNGELEGGFSIIAENCTSALDAIQVLLGATLGNHRLQVIDFGKHRYTLLPRNEENGLRFSLKRQHYGDEGDYNMIEQKIMTNQVMLDEVVQFQAFIDGRVKQLLDLKPEDLFKVARVKSIPRPVETASVYLTCSQCGQQTLKSHIIDRKGKNYCIPCFQRMNIGCARYSMQ